MRPPTGHLLVVCFVAVALFGTKIGTPCIGACFSKSCFSVSVGCSKCTLPWEHFLAVCYCSVAAWYYKWDAVHRNMLLEMTDRQKGRQIGRQPDRQTIRKIDRHTCMRMNLRTIFGLIAFPHGAFGIDCSLAFWILVCCIFHVRGRDVWDREKQEPLEKKEVHTPSVMRPRY